MRRFFLTSRHLIGSPFFSYSIYVGDTNIPIPHSTATTIDELALICSDPTWPAEISGDGGVPGVSRGALVAPPPLVAGRALTSHLLVVVQVTLPGKSAKQAREEVSVMRSQSFLFNVIQCGRRYILY